MIVRHVWLTVTVHPSILAYFATQSQCSNDSYCLSITFFHPLQWSNKMRTGTANRHKVANAVGCVQEI